MGVQHFSDHISKNQVQHYLINDAINDDGNATLPIVDQSVKYFVQ